MYVPLPDKHNHAAQTKYFANHEIDINPDFEGQLNRGRRNISMVDFKVGFIIRC